MKKIYFLILLITQTINSQTAGSGVIDIEGNQYSTVIIGNQEWMTTNLRTTKFTTQSLSTFFIEYKTINSNPSPTTYIPTYFKQGNNDSDIENKGLLYNWFVAEAAYSFVQNPLDGWHIPTQAEWQQLLTTISDNTGEFLTKTNGSILWNCSLNSTNQYNFNLLSTGKVGLIGNTYLLMNFNNAAHFWTKQTVDGNNYAYSISFNCPMTTTTHVNSSFVYDAMSIRLVRNASLSTSSFDKSKVSIYPNPVQNELNIQTDAMIYSIEIFDMLGKRVYSKNQTEKIINIDFLSKGMYLVKINTENQTFNSKIIKE